jgi:adenosylmethionine-8-amino-7-oxononanoate aminotransferase
MTWELPETVAGVIMEPIITGGGIIVAHDDYMRTVEDICEKSGALLIVDEVICGFGRTGRRFGYQHYNVKPDIITMAKGLTSAYFPLAATAVRREVYETFAGDGEYGRLRHINTFGGHPGGCAVALKNLQIMEEEDLPARSSAMGEHLRKALTGLDDHPNVGDVRSKGLLFGIELVENKESKLPASAEKVAAVVSGCKERGLIISKNADTVAGYNNVLTLSPPLIIGEDEVEFIARTLRESISSV